MQHIHGATQNYSHTSKQKLQSVYNWREISEFQQQNLLRSKPAKHQQNCNRTDLE